MPIGDIVYILMDEVVVRQEADRASFFNASLVNLGALACSKTASMKFRISVIISDIQAAFKRQACGSRKIAGAILKYGRDETIVITNKRANRYNEGIRRNINSMREEEIETLATY